MTLFASRSRARTTLSAILAAAFMLGACATAAGPASSSSASPAPVPAPAPAPAPATRVAAVDAVPLALPGVVADALSGAEAPPSYVGAPKGCAVVAGGLGSTFADSRATMIWHTVNTEVTEYLHARMKLEKLRYTPLIVPMEQLRVPDQPVIAAMARNACGRVIQVVHEVAEDAAGRHFTFKVTLLRAQPNGPRDATTKTWPIVMVSEFNKDYRYTRDEKTLETFRMSELAGRIYRDLEASGMLAALRT